VVVEVSEPLLALSLVLLLPPLAPSLVVPLVLSLVLLLSPPPLLSP
jgi:hypothetical protein